VHIQTRSLLGAAILPRLIEKDLYGRSVVSSRSSTLATVGAPLHGRGPDLL